MDATITFKGVARASTNPQFVDHCLLLASERQWEGLGLGSITVHIFPSENLASLKATVAWRGEVFACVEPSSEGSEKVALWRPCQRDRARDYTDEMTVNALAQLLNQHLTKRREELGQKTKAVEEGLERLCRLAVT